MTDSTYVSVCYMGREDMLGYSDYEPLGVRKILVKDTDSQRDIEEMFKRETGFTAYQLKYRGNKLCDAAKLWDYIPDLAEDLAPRFVLYSNTIPEIFIKSVKSRSCAVAYDASDTVAVLQQKVFSETDVPVGHQLLSCDGVDLTDSSRTLISYSITAGCTLTLLRIRQLKISYTPGISTIEYSIDHEPTDTIKHVKEQIQQIQQQHRMPQAEQQLAYDGVELDDDERTLSSYGIAADASIVLTRRRSSRPTVGECTIYIKTLTGKSMTLSVTLQSTVLAVKQQIQDTEGELIVMHDAHCCCYYYYCSCYWLLAALNLHDNFCAVYYCNALLQASSRQAANTSLCRLEEARTLADYYVNAEDSIHLILRLRGGGITGGQPFADVSNADALEVLSDDDSAPVWREYCIGLNIEGVCTNGLCAAHRQQVICMQHITSYVLGSACECPQCGAPAQPVTCGFAGCFWRFDGRKVEGQDEQSG
jgi:Ubiquitin family